MGSIVFNRSENSIRTALREPGRKERPYGGTSNRCISFMCLASPSRRRRLPPDLGERQAGPSLRTCSTAACQPQMDR